MTAPQAQPAPPTETPEQPAAAETGVKVSGSVVDAETDEPVAGALVRSTAGGESQLTDFAGSFVFDGAPSHRPFGILVSKDGQYLPEMIDVRVPKGAQDHDLGNVRLFAGEDSSEAPPAQGQTGIIHELRDGKTLITRVRPASPAEAAGLRKGTRIVSIDGHSADGLGYTARQRLLNGEEGSTVSLVVETRTGLSRTVTLERLPPWSADRVAVR